MPHRPKLAAPPAPADAFDALLDAVKRSGSPFTVHEHAPSRIVEDACALPFDRSRLVKAIAFGTRKGGVVLAAVVGSARVDYASLAALVGVSRREISSLSAEEAHERLGVEPGSISPIPLRPGVLVVVDESVLSLQPTLYCGIGRPDRTLEIAPADLVRLTDARVAPVARPHGGR
jgi:Cys-tRNA(Pro)/Cys-tRNA(Cys) deacylase